jgi:hypothetical protein
MDEPLVADEIRVSTAKKALTVCRKERTEKNWMRVMTPGLAGKRIVTRWKCSVCAKQGWSPSWMWTPEAKKKAIEQAYCR